MGGATRSFVRNSPSSRAPTAIARQNDPKPRPRAPPLPHNGTHPPRKTRHPSPACRYLWMKSPESAPPAIPVPTSPAFVQPSFRGAPHTQPRSQHPVPRATKTPNSFLGALGTQNSVRSNAPRDQHALTALILGTRQSLRPLRTRMKENDRSRSRAFIRRRWFLWSLCPLT